MTRSTFLSMLMLVCGSCGCAPTDEGRDHQSTPIHQDAATEQGGVADVFQFDEAAGVISMSLAGRVGQIRRFDIGQGSVTLEIIEANDNQTTFRFTPEIEGGYTTYECKLPVTTEPITIQINQDGTPGPTSFDLSKCRMIKSGNALLE